MHAHALRPLLLGSMYQHISSMYADFTVAAPKYWNSLPHELRTICHLLLLINVDYIHICYHYNVFFLNLLLFVYLFI